MFAVESCRHCPVCDTVTPHSRRRFSVAWCAASGFAIVAAGMFSIEPTNVADGFIFAFIALAIVAFDRERAWHVRCERCRDRARRELAKTKPDLETTQIDVL